MFKKTLLLIFGILILPLIAFAAFYEAGGYNSNYANFPLFFLNDGATYGAGFEFTTPSAADVVYTFPDKSGTIAMLSDITNGTSTQDIDWNATSTPQILNKPSILLTTGEAIGGTLQEQVFKSSTSQRIVLGGGNVTGSEVKFNYPGVAHFSIYNSGDGNLTIAQTSAQAETNILGNPLMVVSSAGNIGIGTLAPNSPLEIKYANSNNGARLTLSNPSTVISANDSLGELLFRSYDVSTNGAKVKAYIKGTAQSTFTGGNHRAQLEFGTSNGTNDPTTKMTLDSDGILTVNGGGSTNHAICWKNGVTLGYCSTVIGSDGTCTCN